MDALDRLLARAVAVGVIGPLGSGRSADTFAARLLRTLQTRGFAAYHAEMGPTREDVRRAVRRTLPGTTVVFIAYAPGDYGLAALLRGVLGWRLRGCAIVLCRSAEPFRAARQRALYALVRALALAELHGTDDVTRALDTWPALRLPPPAPLARAWTARHGQARVEEILGVLRCPRCRVGVERDGDVLRCANGHAHPIVDGIPVLLPETVDLDVAEHEAAHAAGDAYACGAEANLGWLEIGLYKRDVIARLLRDRTPNASLDVGCGDWGLHHDVVGAIGTRLAIAGDVSLELVRHARTVATAPGRVHHVVFAAEALPFADGTFDLVHCSEVLEHLRRPADALAEMRRVGAGGRVLLTAPNEALAGKLEDGHLQTFGYDDFLALVSRDVEVERTIGVYRYAERDPNALARTPAGRRRLASLLRSGEARPRESLNILVDGRLRP